MALGSGSVVHFASGYGHLHSVFAAGIFNCELKSRRLAALHNSGKFGAVVARTKQDLHTYEGEKNEKWFRVIEHVSFSPEETRFM